MRKYKNPTDKIEAMDSSVEHAYIKYPGRDLADVTLKNDSRSVTIDGDKVKKERAKNNSKQYTSLHNHPHKKNQYFSALPSNSDLKSFYNNSGREKSMAIAQQSVESGKVQGYFYLTRGNEKRDPSEKEMDIYEKKLDKLKYIKKSSDEKKENFAKRIYNEVDSLSKDLGWKYKFVPTRGYKFLKEKGIFEKKSKLENSLQLFILALIISPLILLSIGKFTGMSILEYESNFLGNGFYILVILMVGFFYVKKRFDFLRIRKMFENKKSNKKRYYSY